MFFFRKGWVANLLWIAYEILFPEIVSHLNSEIFGKKVLIWTVRGIIRFQEESPILEREKDLNLNGFIYLKYLFLKIVNVLLKNQILKVGWRNFVLSRKHLFFWKASSAKFEGWKASRGSRLSRLDSLPVSPQWASFEFQLIDFLCL